MYETVKRNLKYVITTQYVEELLDEVAVENGNLVNSVKSKYGDKIIFTIKTVLASLLEEPVSIRDIIGILEVLYYSEQNDAVVLSELARHILGHAIISNICDGDELNVIGISGETTSYILKHCGNEKCERKFIDDFFSKTYNTVTEVNNKDILPVILVPDEIRKTMWRLLALSIPDITVISLSEVTTAMEKSASLMVNTVAEISVDISCMDEDKTNPPEVYITNEGR